MEEVKEVKEVRSGGLVRPLGGDASSLGIFDFAAWVAGECWLPPKSGGRGAGVEIVRRGIVRMDKVTSYFLFDGEGSQERWHKPALHGGVGFG